MRIQLDLYWIKYIVKTFWTHGERLAADGSGTQQYISLILNSFRICGMNY